MLILFCPVYQGYFGYYYDNFFALPNIGVLDVRKNPQFAGGPQVFRVINGYYLKSLQQSKSSYINQGLYKP